MTNKHIYNVESFNDYEYESLMIKKKHLNYGTILFIMTDLQMIIVNINIINLSIIILVIAKYIIIAITFSFT